MDNVTTFLVSISALLLAIVTLINNIYKSKEDIKNTVSKKLKDQSNIDMDIMKKLENLKEYLVADRVQVYKFHNGGYYANGQSILKVDCSYEVVRKGITGHQQQLQNIPNSCIPHFIKEILDKGEMQIDNLETIKDEMPSTYQLKSNQGIKSFYDIVIKDKNNEDEPIGFLAIQYCSTNQVNFTEKEKVQILMTKDFIEENLAEIVRKEKK